MASCSSERRRGRRANATKENNKLCYIFILSALEISNGILRIPSRCSVKILPDVFMLGFLISKEYAFVLVCESIRNF